MSVSAHMNGKTRGDMKQGLLAHQERFDEEEGKDVARNSDSDIDPSMSHLNHSFMQAGPNKLKELREKHDRVNQKREDMGKRKLRKDANICMVGTLQIGDDSLESLGWKFDDEGKKLPAGKQDPETIQTVTDVYADMLESAKAQPEIYGDIYTATLHFDEGSPHVDFMSDPLNEDDPLQTARDFLNGRSTREGGKRLKKGAKLEGMQDNLMKFSKLDPEFIKKHNLVRGEKAVEKRDKIKDLRGFEKQLKDKEKAFKTEKEAFKTEKDVFKREKSAFDVEKAQLETTKQQLNAGIEKLAQDRDDAQRLVDAERADIKTEADKNTSEALKLSEERSKLDKRELGINERETDVNAREASVTSREDDVDEKEKAVIKKAKDMRTDFNARKILLDNEKKDIEKLAEEVKTERELVEKLKNGLITTRDTLKQYFSRISDIIKDGRQTSEMFDELGKIEDKHNPITEENAESYATEGLNKLRELDFITDDDLLGLDELNKNNGMQR